MKQEGMTFDHDFCYFILLFSSLLKKEGREKENDVVKIVIKSHTFLFNPGLIRLNQKFFKPYSLKTLAWIKPRFKNINQGYFFGFVVKTWHI